MSIYGTDYTCVHGEPPDDCEKCVDEELHRSQLRMAERLAVAYGDKLRYAHGLGWLEWDGTRWRRERDGAPMRAAVEVVKAAVRENDGADLPDGDLEKDVRKVETAAGLRGILDIARVLRPLAIAADLLDADPYLVNVANGTFDIRQQTLRPHNPADLITKLAGCRLDASVPGPTFEKFLSEILPDAEVRAFVQRLFGYALMGKVTEHVLPIFTGIGCNGKSTLVELLLAAFGDYAIAADPELLVEQKFSQHPTGQADLLGVRLAVTQETDEGRRLAAATVKRLTGGDKIRARRMRQDFFEFEPSHTAIMVTNHRPRVSGDDPALWRRIRVVPFDVVVAEPDSTLPERLRLELDAVLTWVVDGYVAYQEHGLAAPSAVTERTAEYRVSSDAVGRFLEERTTAGQYAHVRARELFGAWSSWCHGAGESPGSEVTFAEALARRGFDKVKRAGYVTYVGIGLLADDDEEESPK
jgi:putative DNA primase/helicase